MRSRTVTAVAGLLVSLTVSLLAWYYLDTLLVFLVLPFVPILFRGSDDSGLADDAPPVRECPRCGFRTENPEFDYCPRDGTRLDER